MVKKVIRMVKKVIRMVMNPLIGWPNGEEEDRETKQ